MVANEPISKGDFVIEYKTKEVYRLRQRAAHIKEYDMNGEGSYVFEIQTSNGKWCLDATRRMDSLGRLMNHSVCPSLKPFKPGRHCLPTVRQGLPHAGGSPEVESDTAQRKAQVTG